MLYLVVLPIRSRCRGGDIFGGPSLPCALVGREEVPSKPNVDPVTPFVASQGS